MYHILMRAGCFIAIILMGMLLRRVGYFKEEDFHVLSKIVLKITLTCAIITNFTGRELELSMLLLTLIGFTFGAVMIILGIVFHARKGRDAQAFAALNLSGCNIGTFALPFAQNFLGPVGVMAVSLFDVGNSFICLGGAFSIASMIKDKQARFSIGRLLRTLTKSVPLITYVSMTVLCLLHITLPGPVLAFAEITGNANTFLAMLMIGVGFHLTGNKEQIREIFTLLGTRYACGIALALLSWFVLPLPLEYRQALVIVSLAPIAAAAPPFTAEMKGDFGLASAVNSISILISILMTTLSLMLIL